MEETTNRAEAERLLGIAEKLLQNRDLVGSREFAVLAQESAPLLDGSDLILAISDVLLAADKRINSHHNWYAILHLDGRTDDLDFIKKQYRRLALLLHPDKNKFPFAHEAFQLVSDAWAVLSDLSKKSLYDNELSMYSAVDLGSGRKKQHHQNDQGGLHYKLPVRKSPAATQRRSSSFWTACPYCYNLYEYPRVYQDCCLKCNNCGRAIHAAEIPSLPPAVQGKDAYYCCWGFFPMGFMAENGKGGTRQSGFPNWVPPLFGNTAAGMGAAAAANGGFEEGFVNVSNQNGNVTPVNVTPVRKPVNVKPVPGTRKRGRPRKIV